MRTYHVTCVPADEHHDLISYAHRRDEKLLEGSWVRFRHGEHKGDLAMVIGESQTSDSVSVVAIPRIPMGPFLSTGKRQRPAPVSAALFDPKIVEMVYGQGSVTQVQDRYRFENRTYWNGLLLLDDQAVSSLNTEPHPSLDEVIPFHEAQVPAIKRHCMVTLKRESIRNVWQRGDCVQVLSGELSPLQGLVESLDLEAWSAAVQGDWTDDNKLSIQDIPFNCLERRILAGDSVLVVAGRSKERCGIVVSVGEGNVTFVDYGTKEEVRLFVLIIQQVLRETQITVSALFVKSYVNGYVVVPSSSPPAPSFGLKQSGKVPRSDPLIGSHVIILKNPTYKGWRGEIRAVGLRRIQVAIGYPSTLVSCKRSDLALL
jgi:transcription elongation factor